MNKFYEIDTPMPRFENIIRQDLNKSFFKVEKTFTGNLPDAFNAAMAGQRSRTFHAIDLIQLDTATYKEKMRTPLAHCIGRQTNDMLAEECQLMTANNQRLYHVLQEVNDQLDAEPNAEEIIRIETQRETLLKALQDVLEIDRDGLVAVRRIDRYTKYPKESTHFVSAENKDNRPYGITKNGEEVLICAFENNQETKEHIQEAVDFVISGAEKLIFFRDKRESLAKAEDR